MPWQVKFQIPAATQRSIPNPSPFSFHSGYRSSIIDGFNSFILFRCITYLKRFWQPTVDSLYVERLPGQLRRILGKLFFTLDRQHIKIVSLRTYRCSRHQGQDILYRDDSDEGVIVELKRFPHAKKKGRYLDDERKLSRRTKEALKQRQCNYWQLRPNM